MHYQNIAHQILFNIGGVSNITSLVHCTTRLRFKLNNPSLANKNRLKQIEGVMMVVESAGQLQIVIGSDVNIVYQHLTQQIEKYQTTGITPRPIQQPLNPFNTFIDLISGIFIPILGVMTATGVIKGLLALLLACHLLHENSGTYQLLNITSDGLFFFLPLFLGYTAGKKFDTNPFLTMAIGAAMVHPLAQEQFQLVLNAELNHATTPSLYFLGIPINYINYASSVIPIIFSAWICSKFEKFFFHLFHKTIRNILSPVCCLLLVVPLTFLLIGPISNYLSQGLALGYTALYTLSPIICGFILGGVWQILVIFGLHWGTVPITYNNIATLGHDTLLPLFLPAVISQAAASFAIMLKNKDHAIKSLSLAATVSAIFGVTEPAIYGVTLPRKIPFIFGCIGGAIGGAIVGYYQSSIYSLGLLTIFSLAQMIPKTGIYLSVYGAVAACLIAAFITFILTLLFYKEESYLVNSAATADKRTENNDLSPLISAVQQSSTIKKAQEDHLTGINRLKSPLEGEIIPLEQVPDIGFSTELMGKSIAILPSSHQLLAPCNATVCAIASTKHAISLLTDIGAEILIHIGIDTVMLEGKPYTVHVEIGQRIAEGDQLISFDHTMIKQANLSLITLLIITNSDEYQLLFTAPFGTIQLMDDLITLSKNKEG